MNTDLISRQAAIKDAESWVAVDEYEKHLQKNVIEWLKEIPPAQSEIIRCKDCKYTDGCEPIEDGRYWCCLHQSFMYYCSDAERREDDGKNQN